MKLSTFLFLLVFCSSVSARPFKIISNNSQGAAVTDTLKSGNFILGINDYGGGSISQITLPSTGRAINIMGPQSCSYGRMGQTCMRDGGHGKKYNPTQAGFTETIGTECVVTKTPGKAVVEPRGCALWRGDGVYDFTRWENIGPDAYDEVALGEGPQGAADQDMVDEENLSRVIDGVLYTQQEAEVYSEFDFYGTYENWQGKNGVTIPAFRNYYEYRFVRSGSAPYAAMLQHNQPALTAAGLWDATAFQSNIATNYPKGIFASTMSDMSSLQTDWLGLRYDIALWKPGYRYTCDLNGVWTCNTNTALTGGGYDNTYKTMVILAESNDQNTGNAVGYYRPNSEINTNQIIGVKTYGSIYYTDNRSTGDQIIYSPTRTPSMGLFGFRNQSKGMIGIDRLPAGIHETFRGEAYLFYGTPAQIIAAITTMEALKKNQTITFIEMPIKKTGDADFQPATSNSGLVCDYSSSDTNVATIVNGKVHIVGAGTADITANQIGNTSFNAANNVVRKLTVQTQTALATVEDNADFQVYPNPAKDKIQFRVNNIDNCPLKIYNSVGKLVYSNPQIVDNFSVSTKEIGDAGIYFVNANGKNQKLVLTN